MEYYAHERQLPDGKIERQTVLEHLTGAARRAAECLKPIGMENTGYLAGLLHDMGKCTEDFQRYLAAGDSGKRGSVIHTFQGCRYVMENFHRKNSDFPAIVCSELLAFAIGAHHSLFDCVDKTQRIGLQYRTENNDVPYDEAVAAFKAEISEEKIEKLFEASTKEIDRVFEKLDNIYPEDHDYAFGTGLFARLILSAVIEGDRCDTAAFMNGIAPAAWPENMSPVWRERLNYLEEKLKQFPRETPVENARYEISKMCRTFAEHGPGIFRLNVPTGGGKTLSSLRYALAHAMCFNKRRLIFTSPLLSILEQNASVIHEFVGDERMILEHHSNVVKTEQGKDELDDRELLMQSWDAPIIITTLVQLLNTMFEGKTTSIRRFHALCDSVIVIDEVQTVPAKMLTLFNMAIEFLTEQCGATVVLCSATQPELESADHPLLKKPEDIVPRNDALWSAFRRTELSRLPDCCLKELPDVIRTQMKKTDSLLVVCNKKDEASYLLKETASPCYKSYHLSAAMCMQHRRDVLMALQETLSNREKVLCIATQVIEAGVDISFESVIRLTAGMDSIVQAAGRCNRNGESDMPRPVYTVNCSDEKLGSLRDIQRGKDASIELMETFKNEPKRFGNNMFSNEAICYYYRALYRGMSVDEQDYSVRELGTTLFELMATNGKYADERCENIDAFFLRQALKTAGQYFSVFDEDTTDVIVPYGRGKQLIAQLCSDQCSFDPAYRAGILKEASNYTVGIYKHQKKRLEENNGLISACDDCAWILAEGFYDDEVGLTINSEKQIFMEV